MICWDFFGIVKILLSERIYCISWYEILRNSAGSSLGFLTLIFFGIPGKPVHCHALPTCLPSCSIHKGFLGVTRLTAKAKMFSKTSRVENVKIIIVLLAAYCGLIHENLSSGWICFWYGIRIKLECNLQPIDVQVMWNKSPKWNINQPLNQLATPSAASLLGWGSEVAPRGPLKSDDTSGLVQTSDVLQLQHPMVTICDDMGFSSGLSQNP